MGCGLGQLGMGIKHIAARLANEQERRILVATSIVNGTQILKNKQLIMPKIPRLKQIQ